MMWRALVMWRALGAGLAELERVLGDPVAIASDPILADLDDHDAVFVPLVRQHRHAPVPPANQPASDARLACTAGKSSGAV